jgi:hypothetical protein
VHRKARYADQIAIELEALELATLGIGTIELVRPGHTYEL